MLYSIRTALDHRPVRCFLSAALILFFAFESVRLGMGERPETFCLRLTLSVLLNLTLVLTAGYSVFRCRTHENFLLLAVLLFYMAGDLLALNSSWFSASSGVLPVGIAYGLGHLLFLFILLAAVRTRAGQFILFFFLYGTVVLVMFHFRGDIHPLPAFFVYIFLVLSVFCVSLGSRRYRICTGVFLISDLAGFLRMTVPVFQSPLFHIFSLGLYYTGITILALSPFSPDV